MNHICCLRPVVTSADAHSAPCSCAGADAPCIQEGVKLLAEYLRAHGEAPAAAEASSASLLEGWAFAITSVLPEVGSCCWVLSCLQLLSGRALAVSLAAGLNLLYSCDLRRPLHTAQPVSAQQQWRL